VNSVKCFRQVKHYLFIKEVFFKINVATEKKQEGKNVSSSEPVNTDTSSNTIKDPDEWTTGDEPMTGAQQSYLKTLSDEAGETPVDDLTKAEASKRIDELRHKTGRGLKNQQE
jgi:hypothetical protein